MPKCDFNKVTLQFYGSYNPAWLFSYKLVAIVQDIFLKEHLWRAASGYMVQIHSDRLSLSDFQRLKPL